MDLRLKIFQERLIKLIIGGVKVTSAVNAHNYTIVEWILKYLKMKGPTYGIVQEAL